MVGVKWTEAPAADRDEVKTEMVPGLETGLGKSGVELGPVASPEDTAKEPTSNDEVVHHNIEMGAEVYGDGNDDIGNLADDEDPDDGQNDSEKLEFHIRKRIASAKRWVKVRNLPTCPEYFGKVGRASMATTKRSLKYAKLMCDRTIISDKDVEDVRMGIFTDEYRVVEPKNW